MTTATGLVHYDQARRALAECSRIDDAKAIRDKAEALRAYARQVKDVEMERWVAEIKLRAELRIGELSKELEKAPSGRAAVSLRNGAKSKLSGKSEALKEAGISKDHASRSEKLARHKEDVETYIAETSAKGKPVTVKDALKVADAKDREATKEKKRAEMKASAASAPTSDAWRVVHGDCRDVLTTIEPASVRLIFCDPPYNIRFDYGTDGHDDAMPEREYLSLLRGFIASSVPVLTPDGSLWVLINHEWGWHVEGILREAGLVVRDWITWYESFGVNCTGKFNRCSRRLFHAVKDPNRFVFNEDAVKRPSDREAKYKDKRAQSGGKLWDDVWGINPPIPRLTGTCKERIPDSSNQLPLALLRPIVGCASDHGDLVVDCFCGSGTTGEAAIRIGRRFLGIEKDAKFAELSSVRLRAARKGSDADESDEPR